VHLRHVGAACLHRALEIEFARRLRRTDAQHQDVVIIETEIDLHQAYEAADEEPCADQQQHREGHFGDHECSTQPLRGGARG
jgi:hypothetical protein